jgi:hypothetical protein
MATMLEEYTTEEQISVVCYLWAKELSERDIHKEMLFSVGNVCHLKRFTTGLRNSLNDVRKSMMMTDRVALLRLRQKQLFSGWKS